MFVKESLSADYWKPHEAKYNIPEGAFVITAQDEWKDLLQTLSQLYLNGNPINWKEFDKPFNRKKVTLPTYPFQRESYWVEALKTKQSMDIVASYFYEIEWKPKPLGQINKLENRQDQWIVFSEDNEFSRHLIKLLQSQGNQCHVFESVDSVLQSKEDAFNLLQDLSKHNPIKGIVFFPGNRASHLEDLNQLIDPDLKSGPSSFPSLITLNPEQMPLLCFATENMQSLSNETINISATPLNGFYKTLSLEYPNIPCLHIDLDPLQTPHENSELLISELMQGDNEGQVAYRQNNRYVPRFIKFKEKVQSLDAVQKFDPTSNYLITGGLGGLGLKVAEWLVSQGAKHLVLVGRKAPQKANLEILDQMRKQGVQLAIEQLDISNKQAVLALMQKFGKDWPELKGIIHAAGVLEDATLLSQDWTHFEHVMAPKVNGAWNLHLASLSKPLDFFVLFSSAASVLGSPGQINYASANAFLDGLAHLRQKKGLPGLAISWGPWV